MHKIKYKPLQMYTINLYLNLLLIIVVIYNIFT